MNTEELPVKPPFRLWKSTYTCASCPRHGCSGKFGWSIWQDCLLL